MHELSIVEALIEQVQRELHRSNLKGKVQGIDLCIGKLSGVNCDSLRFAFDLLLPETPLAKAKINILEPKAYCVCRQCNARCEIDDLVVDCPKCGSADIVIEGGRDLMLQSIDVED